MDIISMNNNNNNNNNNTRFIGNNMERQDIYMNDNNPTGSSCTTENVGSESPNSSTIFNDFSKINTLATSSVSSPKKSGSGRRSVQKRVVSIPIKEVEGTSRLKGESCHVSTPPSDSWAWRKYGQKPIKGSPYPRGYYRCSSSKGCPARKQVERSRVDPTMLLVTYSAEHNHPWPVSSRNNHNNSHKHHQSPPATSSPPQKSVKDEDEEVLDQEADQPGPAEPDPEAAEERFSFVAGDEFGWFGAHMDTATLESPIFADGGGGGACDSLAAVFPMGEEDESLFADLGELPECSLVFRHRGVGPQVEIC